jgi:hypothetical protein
MYVNILQVVNQLAGFLILSAFADELIWVKSLVKNLVRLYSGSFFQFTVCLIRSS